MLYEVITGLPVISPPIAEALPVTTFSTPAGMPARSASAIAHETSAAADSLDQTAHRMQAVVERFKV